MKKICHAGAWVRAFGRALGVCLRGGLAGAMLLAGLGAGSAAAADARYYYDELGRLIETVAADGSSVQYTYDAVGNILSVRHNTASTLAISGFVPLSGPAGTTVSIFGSGFNATASSNTVKFNGIAATVSAASATSLTVTVPAGATSGPISVTNGAASASSAGSFTVATLPAPTLTSFTPTIGAQGTAVTLTVTNFQLAKESNKVTFGSITAPVAGVPASTTLTTTVPGPASSGKISIVTPYGVATSTADFFGVPSGYSASDVQATGRIYIGGSALTRTISTAGKIGIVLFDGAVGLTGVYLELSTVTMGGSVSVFNPDGTLLKSGTIADGASLGLPKLPASGTYTVLMAPGNNTGSVTLHVGTVDLSVGSLSTTGPIVANRDGSWTIPVTFTVTNSGTAAAPLSWYDVGYLSADGTLDDGDQKGTTYLNLPSAPLAAGGSYTIRGASFRTSTTTAPGNYTLFVKTDGRYDGYGIGGTNTDGGYRTEVNETNNTASVPVSLIAPDLVISNLTVGTAVANHNGTWSIPISYVVKNNSGVDMAVTTGAAASWYDVAYLSTDGTLDDGDQSSGANPLYVSNSSGGSVLAAGASYTVTNAIFTTSTSTTPGNYTLFVKADGHNTASAPFDSGPNTDNGGFKEAIETNNVASAGVALGRPDLAISGLTLSSVAANIDGSFTISVNYKVTNVGTGTAQPDWYDVGYLSTDATLDNADQSNSYLNYRASALAPGDSYVVSASFTTSASTAAGSYTFFVKTDGHSGYYPVVFPGGTNTDNGAVIEATKANNRASQAVTLSPPDLSVSGLSVTSVQSNSDATWTLQVSYTVKNVGAVTAPASWYDIGYLSTDAVLDNGDQTQSYLNFNGTPLAPGASYPVNTSFKTAAGTAAGSYNFFVKADGHNASYTGGTNTDNGNLREASESNNTMSVPVKLDADLKFSAFTVGTVKANPDGSWTIPVSYTVTNMGTSAAVAPNWYDVAYLSSGGTLDSTGAEVGRVLQSTVLAPGSSYPVSTSFTVGAGKAPGAYTFFLKTDGHSVADAGGSNTDGGSIVEANEANNVASAPVNLVRPDLTVSGLSVNAVAMNPDHSWSITVTYTVKNVGTIAAQPNWFDIGYLSIDATLDNADQSDIFHAINFNTAPLAPGASYTMTGTFTTNTTTAAGTYTLFVKADGHNAGYTGGTNTDNGAIAEANETNNAASATVVLH